METSGSTHKSPRLFALGRTGRLAGKTCGSEGWGPHLDRQTGHFALTIPPPNKQHAKKPGSTGAGLLQSDGSILLSSLSGLSLNGRSFFFGNLGGGFSFLHNSLLGNRLGDELDDGCRSGIRHDAEQS